MSEIVELPQLRHRHDHYATTYLGDVFDAIGIAARMSASELPAGEVQVAIHHLLVAIDRAVEASPMLRDIFDKQKPLARRSPEDGRLCF